MVAPPRRGRLLLLALLAGSCQYDAVVGDPTPSGSPVPVRLARSARADVLLVVDSSASMAGKQERLGAALQGSLPLLSAWGSVHLAVVTTDLGAGGSAPAGCRPGGDDAALSPVGAAAAPGCPGVSDGADYLSIDFTTGASNVAGGDLGAALGCLPRVGTAGCAFEQPLEAAFRALSRRGAGGALAKGGFLRDDAVLVLVFVTDEDDCSTPGETDLFDPAATAAWGPLTSLRCARAGLRFGTPPMPLPAAPTGGPLPMPSADETGSTLQPLSRYRTLLSSSALGGVKADANDVVVVSFAGPAEPVEVVAAPPSLEPNGQPPPCDGPLDGVACAAALRPGCVASADPSAFGLPAPRLSALVRSVSRHYQASICETDHRQALADVVALVAAREAGDGCLTAPLADPGSPDCTVADVVTHNGVSTTTRLPRCDASATRTPCWRVVDYAACEPVVDPRSGQRFTLRLDIARGGVPPPAGSATTATCRGL